LRFGFDANDDLKRISAVFLLLGSGDQGKPVVILNKRSKYVRQAGDLCCPGGGIAPCMDRWFARGLYLPGSPLARWHQGKWWRRHRPADYHKLAILLATALRECFEEMRLNPLAIRFLSPLPKQRLVLFRRDIYPMVGWVHHQRRFFPNWEVEKIVRVPVDALIEAKHYARYRFSFEAHGNGVPGLPDRDMPCFVHRHKGETELLWGVTYRIVTDFLEKILGFTPPAMDNLPVVRRRLDHRYIEGALKS